MPEINDGILYRRLAGTLPFYIVGVGESVNHYLVEYLHSGQRYDCPVHRVVPYLEENSGALEVGDEVLYTSDGVKPYRSIVDNEYVRGVVLEINEGEYATRYRVDLGTRGTALLPRKVILKIPKGKVTKKPKRQTLLSFLEEKEKEYA